MSREIYNNEFFARISSWSESTARIIVPIIMDITTPKSVIDVGCGDGTWLSEFERNGVSEIRGLDGEYIATDILKVKSDYFTPCDLRNPPGGLPAYDLAVSLEVAEHLPSENAEGFVHFLASLSKIVLFSAAIPYQTGENHINTQWQEYWAQLFAKRGYLPINIIRQYIWNEPSIPFFYKQNIALYVEEENCISSDNLRSLYNQSRSCPMSVVHPDHYLMLVKSLAKARMEKPLSTLVSDRIRRRMRHLFRFLYSTPRFSSK